jgi:hypothetical protein
MGFTIPRELAYDLFVYHVLLINHSTDVLTKTTVFYAIDSDLGHTHFAFKRLRGSFPIDIAGQAF